MHVRFTGTEFLPNYPTIMMNDNFWVCELSPKVCDKWRLLITTCKMVYLSLLSLWIKNPYSVTIQIKLWAVRSKANIE